MRGSLEKQNSNFLDSSTFLYMCTGVDAPRPGCFERLLATATQPVARMLLMALFVLRGSLPRLWLRPARQRICFCDERLDQGSLQPQPHTPPASHPEMACQVLLGSAACIYL